MINAIIVLAVVAAVLLAAQRYLRTLRRGGSRLSHGGIGEVGKTLLCSKRVSGR